MVKDELIARLRESIDIIRAEMVDEQRLMREDKRIAQFEEEIKKLTAKKIRLAKETEEEIESEGVDLESGEESERKKALRILKMLYDNRDNIMSMAKKMFKLERLNMELNRNLDGIRMDQLRKTENITVDFGLKRNKALIDSIEDQQKLANTLVERKETNSKKIKPMNDTLVVVLQLIREEDHKAIRKLGELLIEEKARGREARDLKKMVD